MQNDRHPFGFEMSHSFGRPHRAGLDSSLDSLAPELSSGDFAEGLTEDWEAAWIDLGGEG